MKKITLTASLLTVILTIPLAAQIRDGAVFTPATVELILLGIGGLTVVGITQMIKSWLKATGILAYAISGAVSAAATAYVLTKTGGFTIPAFVGYTIFVFLAANGIYKTKTSQ